MRAAVELGSLFYEWREDAYLTQQQLADMLGVTQPSISHWEAGKCLPRQYIMKKLEDMAPGFSDEMGELWKEARREIYGKGRKPHRGRP